jgi:hypothetical protein
LTGQGENVLVGVVGASYSGVTQPLATATFALNLPLISYAASSEGRLHLFMSVCIGPNIKHNLYETIQKSAKESLKLYLIRESLSYKAVSYRL